MKNKKEKKKNQPSKVACRVIALAAFVGLFIKKPAKKE